MRKFFSSVLFGLGAAIIFLNEEILWLVRTCTYMFFDREFNFLNFAMDFTFDIATLFIGLGIAALGFFIGKNTKSKD